MSVRETLKDVQGMQVIRTSNFSVGSGTDDDPYRTIVQYWTIDGELLDECDPFLKRKASSS